ncbi:HD domain-containing protein [Longivirga aurantiaca]|uniref:HD domain-containing protein n=1 Tax=Longivirga aurantiaca TaxID=1837743 RepID=A0ABW1T2U0_9ACTN
MRLDDLARPATDAADRALWVVTTFASPALANHSVRSFLWAAAYGDVHGIAYDAELLYVSAMLHDIGLVASFDSHAVPFERAGGDVARVFAAGAGWAPERGVRAAEIIERHMWDSVDPEADPEGHLLEIATGLDISGRNTSWWPDELRTEVVARYPRLGIGPEFSACFAAEAARKPDSAAAALMRSGIADRIAANALDTL